MKKKTEYNHKKIESKWQKEWEKSGIYYAQNPAKDGASNYKKPKYYSLIEFPYPSGDGLHVGHPRPYIGMDVISRKRRLQGFNVLYPIGWDAFGLPTENYAIKTGRPPAEITKKNTDTFRRQIKSLGISFDWSREINTTDPKYYKWTQWIFLQFLKKGLAYKKKMEINWCPKDKIGLANEEVVNGSCERCGTPVEKREKEQWMLAITKYAERLDKDLDDVDYLPQIKLGQRNWIGRSDGAEIEFKIQTYPLTPSPREGEMPGYVTTGVKEYKELYEKAIEMRKNPTPAEKILWEALRNSKQDLHFRRQHIIDHFIVDFLCLPKNLVVEMDGDIHDYQKERDLERVKKLQVLGYKILRFKNKEVLENLTSVVNKIKEELEKLPDFTLSLGEGRGEVELNATYPPTPSPREGAEVELGEVKVFTTRPDTIFGATYLVLSLEHELVQKLKSQIKNFSEVEKYIKETKNKTEINRTEEKIKTGIELKGIRSINPANKEEIPIWIADYVLATYGTGAIMAVPAHDERDFEFAKKYKLPIIKNYKKVGFEDFGKRTTTFKLRDWIFSRQRYWGEPIPVIHCEDCGIVPVPEKDLPVELPKVKNYQPTDSGESPLANISKWVNVKCPKCKGKAKRETDTMPNWAGSSWYYLRYTDPKNKKEFASKNNLKYWLTTPPQPSPKGREEFEASSFGGGVVGVNSGGVDWYNGGNEHTTLHLLYSRFWHKFLFDLKLVPTSEPYMKRTSHGMILGEGGVKMSKSLGNVINPDDIVKTYGADTLRVYEMFMGPFNQSVAWSTESIIGARRFIEKVWRIGGKLMAQTKNTPSKPPPKGETSNSSLSFGEGKGGVGISKLLNKTIKKVSEDIEEMHFNTAISSMMILATEMEKAESVLPEDYKKFLQILSPFAPHVAEELWRVLGEKKSINLSNWPKADENLMKDEEIKIAVQINGKVRTEILIKVNSEEEKIKKQAVSNEIVLRHLVGKDIKKVIYVKNRLINIVA